MKPFNLTHKSLPKTNMVDNEVLLALAKLTTPNKKSKTLAKYAVNRFSLSLILNIQQYVEMTDVIYQLVENTVCSMTEQNIAIFMKHFNVAVIVNDNLPQYCLDELTQYGIRITI